MNDKTVSLIRELADRLGTTTEAMVELFVPWVVSSAVVWAVLMPVVCGLAVLAVRKAHAIQNDLDRDIPILVSWVLLVVVGFATVASLADLVAVLAAPRAAAILSILDAVRGE